MSTRVQAAIAVVCGSGFRKQEVEQALLVVASHQPIASLIQILQESFARKPRSRQVHPADLHPEVLSELFLLIQREKSKGVPSVKKVEARFRRRMKQWVRHPFEAVEECEESRTADTFLNLEAKARRAGVEPTIEAIAKHHGKSRAKLWSQRQAVALHKRVVFHCEYAERKGNLVVAVDRQRSRFRSSDDGIDEDITGVEDLCDQHDREDS